MMSGQEEQEEDWVDDDAATATDESRTLSRCNIVSGLHFTVQYCTVGVQ